jgi:PncC family amidohydrolase
MVKMLLKMENGELKMENEKLIQELIERNISITTAESCTGGRVASEITKYAGVSSIYPGSVVSYSNEIKQKVLKVSEETLIKYGAVSSECVKEMLDGVGELMGADISVAISGIAGPTGGTIEKPVGLVFIGVKFKEKLLIEKNIFDGSRNEIQEKAKNRALEMVEKII